ncbi:MAG: DUF2797 domain-containing protein [Pontibacterium sp.]
MTPLMEGALSKMPAQLGNPIQYSLPLGDQSVALNAYLGKPISLEWLGAINCSHCGRKTKKSYSQGYCYPCMQKLPQCDRCIMSPELCHYDQGTCRDSSWGEQFCFQDHYVYLSNTSGVKVGITRGTQVPTRWVDQGAVQAMPIMRVATRKLSGQVERIIGEHIADKTNWRKMLKNEYPEVSLAQLRDELLDSCNDAIRELEQSYGIQNMTRLSDAQVLDLNYPVIEYPSKVTAHNFDKTPVVSGVLMGIKGQYLILDTGVLNVRKFTSYNVRFSAEG